MFTPALAGVFSLSERIEKEKIYEDPIWLLLLQYEGGESKIDDPSFFLSGEGKSNPKEELLFFIRELERDPLIRCRFPARYVFLRERLKLPFGSVLECKEVREFIEELKGSRLSIVFADSHINSPASMFGHTFLRIYEKERDVASYIINYAAVTDESFGPFYAFKGIFGFYRGYYSIAPFYIKIKEYSAMEGRDLWEYEVDIDPENLYLLKLHLFEIKNTYSYYYFFQENCSTNVFYLLNFTDPKKRLKVSTFWVIPVDTIKVLIKEGKVKKVMYEPSVVTKLHGISSSLKTKDIEVVKEWAVSDSKLPSGKDYAFYEFAHEYVKFLYFSGRLKKNVYRKKFLEALRKINKSEVVLKPWQYKAEPPHISHDSQRFSLSYGYSKEPYLDLSYRPAYHDLLDRLQGYRPNSEIVFSEISLRYGFLSKKLMMEKWRIIRIVSLEPITRIYKPVSWKVDFGIQRENSRYRAYLNTGGGYSFKFWGLSFFILPEIYFASNAWEIMGGIDIGILKQSNFVSFILNSRGGYFFNEYSKGKYGNIEMSLNISLFLNFSFRVGTKYFWKERYEEIDLFTSANYYF